MQIFRRYFQDVKRNVDVRKSTWKQRLLIDVDWTFVKPLWCNDSTWIQCWLVDIERTFVEPRSTKIQRGHKVVSLVRYFFVPCSLSNSSPSAPILIHPTSPVYSSHHSPFPPYLVSHFYPHSPLICSALWPCSLHPPFPPSVFSSLVPFTIIPPKDCIHTWTRYSVTFLCLCQHSCTIQTTIFWCWVGTRSGTRTFTRITTGRTNAPIRPGWPATVNYKHNINHTLDLTQRSVQIESFSLTFRTNRKPREVTWRALTVSPAVPVLTARDLQAVSDLMLTSHV